MFISIFLAKRKKKQGGAKNSFLTVNFFAILVHYEMKFALTLYIVFFWERKKGKSGTSFWSPRSGRFSFSCTAACLPSMKSSLSVSQRFISQISPFYVCMYVCAFLCFVWYEILCGEVKTEQDWWRIFKVTFDQKHFLISLNNKAMIQWEIQIYTKMKFAALVSEADGENK